MNGENKDLEQVRTRKKKFDLEILWTKCQACLEPGNLENLLRHKLPIKNSQGVELYGAFGYLYFCGENCKGLWNG